MKLAGLTTPLLLAALSVTATWGLGTLAVRSGAVSTRASLDLLRLNLRVARLQEELLRRSRDDLRGRAGALLAGEPGAAAGSGSREPRVSPPEPEAEGAARPWPDGVAEP